MLYPRLSALCGVLLAACAIGLAQAAPAPPTAKEVDDARKAGRLLAKLAMANGDVIEIILEAAQVPLTVANFTKLAKAGYYRDLSFHKVVDRPGLEFVQGGDPKGDGTGGPGYSIRLEVSPTLSCKKRAIVMAHVPDYPSTGGSQFFICQCDMDDLDGQYAVFGWIRTDLSMVDRIKQGDRMKNITIEAYTGDEPCAIAVPPTRLDETTPKPL